MGREPAGAEISSVSLIGNGQRHGLAAYAAEIA